MAAALDVHESQQLLSTVEHCSFNWKSISCPPVHVSHSLPGFGFEKGSVYLVGMLRETRGVVVYGGVLLVGRVVLNGGGGLPMVMPLCFWPCCLASCKTSIAI